MQALTLLAIGDDHEAMGDWRGSFDAYREAGEVAVGAGSRMYEGLALRGQGPASIGMGRPAAARAALLPALEIFVECGDRWEVAHTERSVGDAARDLDDPAQAAAWWTRALRTCDQLASDATVADLAAELHGKLAAVGAPDTGLPPTSAG